MIHFIIVSIILQICRAQIDLYTSSYLQTAFAHKIEANLCADKQDQYAIYFWHRISFTSPDYTDTINPVTLARLTFDPLFQDQTNNKDRVIYVESDGLDLTVCTHDTISNNQNVCQTISTAPYRYDMEWVFMFIEYRRPTAELAIYINFLSQNVQIFDQIMGVTHVLPTGYIGLFIGGDQYRTQSMNGQFYNPQLILGHYSQVGQFGSVIPYFLEQPPKDYVQEQHILIQTSPQTITGIYTKVSFYGVITLSNVNAANNSVILKIDGAKGQAGVNSSFMEVVIKSNGGPDKVEFFTDSYNTITNTVDDQLKQKIATCSITQGQEFFYFFQVNMETGTNTVYCAVNGVEENIGTVQNTQLFVPSELIFTFSTFGGGANGMHLEKNFLGGGPFIHNPSAYLKTKIILDGPSPYTNKQRSGITAISQFSVCFWWRMSSTFPTVRTQVANAANLALAFPLISVNIGPAPITDCTNPAQFLACGYLEGFTLKYKTFNTAAPIVSTLSASAKTEWQWNSSCITYKETTLLSSSITKVYQNFGNQFQETIFEAVTGPNLSSITDLYLQLGFATTFINRQYYNVVIAINGDNNSYLPDLFSFQSYSSDIPPNIWEVKLLEINIKPDDAPVVLPLLNVQEGFIYSNDYAITFWCKLTTNTNQSIAKLSISSGTITFIGNIFEIKYTSATQILSLKSYSKSTIDLSDLPAVEINLVLPTLPTSPVLPTFIDLNKYFFVYAGYSRNLAQLKFAVVYSNSANVLVRTQAVQNAVYHIANSKFTFEIQPAQFSGQIALVKLYLGLYAYEFQAFTEPSTRGKWECSQKTLECSGPEILISDQSNICQSTFVLNTPPAPATTKTCQVQCPCGSFPNPASNNLCTLCMPTPGNCLYCVNTPLPGNCTFCTPDQEVVPLPGLASVGIIRGDCQCRSATTVLLAAGNASCAPCGPRCQECSGTQPFCTKCRIDMYLMNTDCFCLDGTYYTAANTCAPCLGNCLTCTNTATQCTGCDPSKMRVLDSSTSTCICAPNYIETLNAATGVLECVFCDPQAGKFISANTCQNCDPNCLTCEVTSTKCLTCDTLVLRRFLDPQTNTCVCPYGFYSSGGGSACMQCPNSCLTCTSSSFCLICAPSRVLQISSSSIQSCVCDYESFFFTCPNDPDQCCSSRLTASLSDYHSVTRTDLIYFSIFFSQPVRQFNQDISSSISLMSIPQIGNDIVSFIPGMPNQSLTSAQNGFSLKLRWVSPSEIAVEATFLRSIIHKYIFIQFKNSPRVSAQLTAEPLITLNLSLDIKLAIVPPSSRQRSLIENMITFSINMSSPSNGFKQFLIRLFRDSYFIILLFPFFQVCLMLLTLNTILPSNFYHFLRMFTNLTLTEGTSMQEENTQVSFTTYFFRILTAPLPIFQTNMESALKRLNFVNSCVIMAITPILVIAIFHGLYVYLSGHYENYKKQNENPEQATGTKNEETKSRIQWIFQFLNNLSSALIEALLFFIICAMIINFKCQSLLYSEQIIGYFIAILLCLAYPIYISNLYSIFTNKLHLKKILHDLTYMNFIASLRMQNAATTEQDQQSAIASSSQLMGASKLLLDEDYQSNDFLAKDPKQETEIQRPLLERIQGLTVYYPLIDLVRKTAVSIFVISFASMFYGQSVSFLVFQLLAMSYFIALRHHDDFWVYITKIVAEICLLIVLILVFVSNSEYITILEQNTSRYIPLEDVISFLTIGDLLISFMSVYILLYLIMSLYKLINYFLLRQRPVTPQNVNVHGNGTHIITELQDFTKRDDQSDFFSNNLQKFQLNRFQYDCELDQKHTLAYFLHKNNKQNQPFPVNLKGKGKQ